MCYRLLSAFVFALAVAADTLAAGERVALCVGVDDYEHSGFENLKYAQNDATEFATLLRDAGYTVVLMTNATGKADPKLVPTKKNIDDQIEKLVAKRKRDDLVVLAFAGHGQQPDKDPDCYFCPTDAEPDKTRTLVSLDGVYRQLGQCGAGAKVLLADCCRNDPDPSRGRGPGDVLEKAPPKGVFALFACSAKERAYEDSDLKHGVFFHHVLLGLKTVNNGSDEVEFLDLARNVLREVPKTVARLPGKEKKQTPTLKALDVTSTVVLLTRSDREILSDYQIMEERWRTSEFMVAFFKEYGPKRLSAWKAGAERGSSKGMVLYASCLGMGVGVKEDEVEAHKWVRKAAELGNTDALTMMGLDYASGTGVKKDEVEAVKWFRKAADLGNPHAMNHLGQCYFFGRGVGKAEAEGIKWCRKAAELGHPLAMINLGAVYENGAGVGKDEVEAMKWYRKAVDLGSPHAMISLGNCYADGKGTGKDEVEAAKWFGEAVKWFRKGADLGDPTAMTHLGTCHLNGKGVKKDEAEAVKWFRKAADLKNEGAMFYLGLCYEYGLGVGANQAEAVKWYRKAADLGNDVAEEALKRLGKE